MVPDNESKEEREKRLQYHRDYTKAHPQNNRKYWLRRMGLSTEQFDAMVVAQDNKCAICGQEMSRPCIDHDHDCCPNNQSCGKCIRKLLCIPCNIGLGNFHDSVETLKRAIAYLTESKKSSQAAA